MTRDYQFFTCSLRKYLNRKKKKPSDGLSELKKFQWLPQITAQAWAAAYWEPASWKDLQCPRVHGKDWGIHQLWFYKGWANGESSGLGARDPHVSSAPAVSPHCSGVPVTPSRPPAPPAALLLLALGCRAAASSVSSWTPPVHFQWLHLLTRVQVPNPSSENLGGWCVQNVWVLERKHHILSPRRLGVSESVSLTTPALKYAVNIIEQNKPRW